MIKKSLVAFALFLSFNFGFAQKEIPIIRATEEVAYITENTEEPTEWWLTPEAKPDVYVCAKSLKSTYLKIKTDIDSLETTVAPGEHFDFIVMFNSDTCLNRFRNDAPITRYKNLQPATHDTLSFRLTDHNNIVFETVLNKKDTVQLKFDSGSHHIRLLEKALVEKTSLLDKQPGVKEGTTKPDFRKLPRYNFASIDGLAVDSVYVGATKATGHETDGRFGWDIFDGRILEIDYDKDQFIVHSSLDEIPEGYKPFEMLFASGFFFIEADLVFKNEKHRGRFLFDGGYQRSILLDATLANDENIPNDLEVVKTSTLRNSQKEAFVTKVVVADEIQIGDFFPARNSRSDCSRKIAEPRGMRTHFMGGELLKRFNTILDFQNHVIYLKPNGLSEAGYVDIEK